MTKDQPLADPVVSLERRPIEYLAIALILFISSMIVTALGFGAGLIAIPILVTVLEVPLPQAITILGMTAMISGCYVLRKKRDAINWQRSSIVLITKVVFIPVGVYLLTILSDVPKDYLSAGLGSFVLTTAGLRILWRVEPLAELARYWDVLAGAASGILSGMLGMGGPPVLFWALSQNAPKDFLRTAVVLPYVATIPLQVGLIAYSFGPQIGEALIIGLMFSPVTYLGSYCGTKLGETISQTLFRRIAWGFLFLVGATNLTAGWWS